MYAGHTLCNHQAKLYFYVKKPELFEAALADLEFAHQLEIQPDPYFDTYFDFLMPSSLESKINAAEEVLDLLIQQGKNLSDQFDIEHRFYFEEKDNLFEFLEKVAEQDIPFSSMRYTEEKITAHGENKVFMAMILQQLSLDTPEIFTIMEQFEELCEEYSGEYSGWTCEQTKMDKSKLN